MYSSSLSFEKCVESFSPVLLTSSSCHNEIDFENRLVFRHWDRQVLFGCLAQGQWCGFFMLTLSSLTEAMPCTEQCCGVCLAMSEINSRQPRDEPSFAWG